MINMSRFGQGLEREDVLHSNGIAKVASGANMGGTSGESFRQRRQTEINRSTIGSYRAANVHTDYRSPAVRPFQNGARPDISTPARSSTPRTKFNEPTSRNFNPFG